jgi:hypothetical protein
MDQFSQSDRFFSLSPSPLPPPPALLALPPLATYPSKEALFKSIQEWAKDRGYAFSIGKSKRAGSRQKVYYACDRRASPRLAKRQNTQRSTQSRGTGCLFSILAIETPSLGWELRYRPESRFNTHNHSPSQSPAAHPSHRHLSIQAQATTQDLFSAGK